MKFDSVRSAKADIFLGAFGYRESPRSLMAGDDEAHFALAEDTDAFDSVAKARSAKKRDPRELIAIGAVPTSHNEGPDDFELAILVQQKKLTEHPIVEKARRLARGEVQVIVTGPALKRSAAGVGLRQRPLRIGGSIGHYRVTAGTLGCFVKCRRHGGIGILSNNHVLADLNRGKAGDEIVQPGKKDGGQRPGDVVARLYRFIKLDFAPNAINFADCAFATLNDDVDFDQVTVQGPGSQSWPVEEPEDLILEKVAVRKLGRTTYETTGIVTAVSVDNIFVNMAPGDPSKLTRFDRQIAISGTNGHFSAGGDSGSVVFVEGKPVGLLFAGTERGGANGGGVTYANPIGKVLDLLEIDVHRS